MSTETFPINVAMWYVEQMAPVQASARPSS